MGIFGFSILLLFYSCKNDAQNDEPNDLISNSIFDVFYGEQIIEITIKTSLDSLDQKKESEEYQAAQISFTDNEGVGKLYDIKISSRGNTRKRHCSIYPLHLKFPEELLAQTLLAKYKKIKLVRPCHENKNYEEYILREYLCYKLYRILTDNSFRTQMARVTIVDNDDSEIKYSSHYTFLIEDKKQVAKRLGLQLVKRESKTPKFYNQKNYAVMALFQYMIGNTDWNISKQHNLRLFQKSEEESAMIVPYDFDYSGLVNADYAIPFPDKPGRTVRDRFFQWKGKDEEVFKESLKLFCSKKREILATINSCPFSSDPSKDGMREYIKAFYEQIESENALDVLRATTKI